MVVFGDDGEKFGTWPETKKHVYDDGWLARLLRPAGAEPELDQVGHAGRGARQTPPLGKVYLPDGSYREMTEWALPAEQLAEYEQVRRELEHDPRWPRIAPLRARRLLAELQGEVSRSRRDVLADDDGQPPAASRDRRRRPRRR